MKIEVRNARFEKYENRYIFDMHTDEPKLEPEYYTLITPHGNMTLSSGHFLFDGQVFYRDKKHGKNLPSGWSILGRTEK